MARRKVPFKNGEIYHVFNRGVDKRSIFEERWDSHRFLKGMQVFNTKDPVGSLRSYSGPVTVKDPLVEIVAYCLNPNHFHLVLRQVSDGGVSEYIKRLSGGYTRYYNDKYDRSGVLFQGKFKAVHIANNEQLLHVSVYVNLNFLVHNYSGPVTACIRSSWDEYVLKDFSDGICVKDLVLGQFKNTKEYEVFAERLLKGMRERKAMMRDLLFE
jgi:putative transposase